jgi:hypothetical protein
MKLFVVATAAVLSLSTLCAQALTPAEQYALARKAYSERDYSPAGIQKAQDAANGFSQLAAQATDAKEKAQYLVDVSEALYFVGNASNGNAVKIDKHQKGIDAADKATKLLGVPDVTKITDAEVTNQKKRPAAEVALLAEAIYQRGINLGQWGSANGVTESLGRWPELRDSMLTIVNLGYKEIHEYGPFRVLGRGYYKIPGILGGSNKKAEKYLTSAVNGSLAAGQIYSVNGFNNTFLAELLKDLGQEPKARDLLKAFIAADVTTLQPALVFENRQAQKEAADLMASW